MARSLLVTVAAAWIAATISTPANARARKKRRGAPTQVVVAARPVKAAGVGAPAELGVLGAPSPLLPEVARVYQRSYDHEEARRFDEALRDLEGLPAAEQASYLVRLRRGWLLYRAGRHADAVAAYRQAIGTEAGSVEARVGSLMPLIALGQWAEVEQTARGVLEVDPASYLAGLRLAFAVFNRGRFAEAEALYRRVLARYPSDAEARSGLGWSLLKQGKRSSAREQFLEASRAAPRSPTVLSGLKATAGGG